jgi:hypothetical protein
MCITQIWTYRECGCHYHRLMPCHPSFSTSSAPPLRRRVDHLSNKSPSSDRSSASTDGSLFNGGDLFPALSRQCSDHHVMHKNFLEPICDDCLVEELGLQPEHRPILGGTDFKESLNGEEWILESTVEIKIEEEDGDRITSRGPTEDEDVAAEADDEGGFRGRSGHRSGIDTKRDTARISSNLPVKDQGEFALSREVLHRAELEGGKVARAVKAHEQGRCLKPSWPRELRKIPPRMRKGNKRLNSIPPVNSGPVNSLRNNSQTPFSSNKELGAGALNPEDDVQLSSITAPDDVRETTFDTREKIVSLYKPNPEHGKQEVQDTSWPLRLHSDIEARHVARKYPGIPLVDSDTPEQHYRSSSPIPSSPQTATSLTSGNWATYTMQALNIASSEFGHEDFNSLPPVALGVLTNTHADSTSVASTLSSSAPCTAHSSPSPPSTRPTTATSASNFHSPISIHPLSTTLSIRAPHGPSLTSLTSSLRSPSAPSPLLHSTPPPQQLPTSDFVCVHERWAFKGCGCEGPSLVKRCVCDPSDEIQGGERGRDKGKGRGERYGEGAGGEVQDARDGCRASSPMVRTRWFFNASCEGCLERDAVETPGDSH